MLRNFFLYDVLRRRSSPGGPEGLEKRASVEAMSDRAWTVSELDEAIQQFRPEIRRVVEFWFQSHLPTLSFLALCVILDDASATSEDAAKSLDQYLSRDPIQRIINGNSKKISTLKHAVGRLVTTGHVNRTEARRCYYYSKDRYRAAEGDEEEEAVEVVPGQERELGQYVMGSDVWQHKLHGIVQSVSTNLRAHVNLEEDIDLNSLNEKLITFLQQLDSGVKGKIIVLLGKS